MAVTPPLPATGSHVRRRELARLGGVGVMIVLALSFGIFGVAAGAAGRKHPVDFPVLGVLGVLGVSMILFEVILTHAIGRIAGPAWVILMILYYLWYRKREGLPRFGNVPRDWEAAQKRVLESAEEYELLEAYEEALRERDLERAAGTN